MRETSKLNLYRIKNGYDRYFVGDGIDLGCGNDPLSREYFPAINSLLQYDLDVGDAETCEPLLDERFDFVYSSHCLEHLNSPWAGMRNWLRICKKGGFVVMAVPHEIYYEKNTWPSLYNGDHKYSFRLEDKTSMPTSINIRNMISMYDVDIIKCDLVLNNFDFSRFWEDQTLGDAICQIEVVIQKRP